MIYYTYAQHTYIIPTVDWEYFVVSKLEWTKYFNFVKLTHVV